MGSRRKILYSDETAKIKLSALFLSRHEGAVVDVEALTGDGSLVVGDQKFNEADEWVKNWKPKPPQ